MIFPKNFTFYPDSRSSIFTRQHFEVLYHNAAVLESAELDIFSGFFPVFHVKHLKKPPERKAFS
jgi:hypothetical protein